MTPATDDAAAAAATLPDLPARGRPGDPAWLAAARRTAQDWVLEHGFPTTKHEDWRYLKLDPVLETAYVPAEPVDAGDAVGVEWVTDAVAGLGPDLGGARLVFVNGCYLPEASRLSGLPAGARVTSLAVALDTDGQGLADRWSYRPDHYGHAFRALNVVHGGDGALVELSGGTVVDEPIELVFLARPGEAAVLSSPRTVVLAGPGSYASIVETYAGSPGGRYCTNAVTEVVLEEGSAIDRCKLQAESDEGFHFASLDVRQAAGSRLTSRLVSVGARIAREEVDVDLQAEGAQVELGGLYLPGGSQLHDNPVLVDHSAPGCTSHQLYKGIVEDRGHGIFNGRIIVRPGADGTDASQTNKNLLLSDHAEADTRPRLEIFADDVMCTHGAAVGQLDDDALFYLRARGIPLPVARNLLVEGFAQEMVEQYGPGLLRDRVELLLSRRLAVGDDGPRPVVAGEPVAAAG